MLSTTRRAIQQTLCQRYGTYIKRSTQNNQTRMFSSAHENHHGDHHHHHHGPQLDTAYDPALNAKFNLAPIPKDGIFRRTRFDQNVETWSRDADIFYYDPGEMVTIFDRNGPRSLTPQEGLKHLFIAISCVAFVGFGIPKIMYPNGLPFSLPKHPGFIPELVSLPHAKAPDAVVEY